MTQDRKGMGCAAGLMFLVLMVVVLAWASESTAGIVVGLPVLAGAFFVYYYRQGAREQEAKNLRLSAIAKEARRTEGLRTAADAGGFGSLSASLAPWTVVGSYGWELTDGTEVRIGVASNALAVSSLDGGSTKWMSWNDLHELEVGGPGLQITDAGLIGGGFGFWGAVQGVAIASWINQKTRRETINTFLQIRANGGGVLLHSTSILPKDVEVGLGPALGALAARKSGHPDRWDLADQLERLASLRQDGSISDEEFQAAKSRLLGN